MKVAIVGGGNMGLAFARCFAEAGLAAGEDLVILERDVERQALLKESLQCAVIGTPETLLTGCSLIFLAIKPQGAQESCQTVQPYIGDQAVIVSIMAGITLKSLSEWFPKSGRIVRCMPNMPAQIGKGMSVFVPSAGLEQEYCDLTAKYLSATGSCVQVGDESLINAATAVSGCGPGYFFYLIEFMQQTAEELGFSAVEARQLISETMIGAASQWSESNLSAADLRKMVTSKGGATAEAIRVFQDEKLGESFSRGMKKAFERTLELAKLA
jgi:pyrroline-5-carboxylate reductase